MEHEMQQHLQKLENENVEKDIPITVLGTLIIPLMTISVMLGTDVPGKSLGSTIKI